MDVKPFIKLYPHVMRMTGGNLKAAGWYGCLLDYSKRFRVDKYGYMRIPSKITTHDYGVTKDSVRRANEALEKVGLIEVDKIKRGFRNSIGYKIKHM